MIKGGFGVGCEEGGGNGVGEGKEEGEGGGNKIIVLGFRPCYS